MSTSLYDLSIASYLQVVGATSKTLDKAAKHCAENDIDLEDIVASQIYPDMKDFQFQIVCVAHHSLGAIRGVMAGEFRPPAPHDKSDYAGLQRLLESTLSELAAVDRQEVNACEDRNVVFKLGDMQIPFTSENFVLSFSLPNLYFHATTAYDLLRMQGVPLGKRDFLGRLRVTKT